MESIDILTGQHITIKYEPAGIVRRMFAFILDYLFMFLYILAVIFAIDKLNGTITQENTSIIIAIILLLPIIFYHVLFETLMSGQTPGKVITKIRVTNVDGSTPNFVSYFLRWVLLIIDMYTFIGIGAFLIIFTKKHQRLGDLAAGTTVVKLVPSAAKYHLDNVFNDFKTNYKPTFPQVEALTEGQIRLISELLENPSEENDAVLDSIDRLAAKIKQKLHVESAFINRRFLEVILKDYNYYATMA